MQDSTNTILLNIMQQLGDIRQEIGNFTSQLSAGKEDRDILRHGQDAINAAVEILKEDTQKIDQQLKAITEIVNLLVPDVSNLKEFRGKLAAVILGASSVLSLVFWVIWAGLGWLFSHAYLLKDAVSGLFSGH